MSSQDCRNEADLSALEGLIALDSRTVTTTETSALISIPGAKDCGIVDSDITASVSVRRDENEIVVTARLPLD